MQMIHIFIVPIQKIAFLNIQAKCTLLFFGSFTYNFKFKLHFILQLNILFLFQALNQLSFFKLLEKTQIAQNALLLFFESFTYNFKFKLHFILQLNILFLFQALNQLSFFKLLERNQIAQMNIFI